MLSFVLPDRWRAPIAGSTHSSAELQESTFCDRKQRKALKSSRPSLSMCCWSRMLCGPCKSAQFEDYKVQVPYPPQTNNSFSACVLREVFSSVNSIIRFGTETAAASTHPIKHFTGSANELCPALKSARSNRTSKEVRMLRLFSQKLILKYFKKKKKEEDRKQI